VAVYIFMCRLAGYIGTKAVVVVDVLFEFSQPAFALPLNNPFFFITLPYLTLPYLT
jgi:hypothetical protein